MYISGIGREGGTPAPSIDKPLLGYFYSNLVLNIKYAPLLSSKLLMANFH